MSFPGSGARAWLGRNAGLLLALTGLAAAAWATWMNLSSVQPADLPHPTPLPTASTSEQAAVALPAFVASKGDDGHVSRRASLFTELPHRTSVEVIRYTVQPGDSVFAIAKKFGLKPETVLFGNFDVLNDDPHLLQPGQELNILPVDGTYYQWKEGDNLENVADFFDVDVEAIVDWPGNELDPLRPVVAAGTWLVVPGGVREFKQWLVPTIARGSAGVGTAFGPGGCSGDFSGGAVGGGGFIWPSSKHTLSGNDFWSGHLAIDIAAGEGERVWAADGGVVVYAGWSYGGYGNMVMIDHGTGYQTLYAHLSAVAVSCGQSVGQGSTIGFAGTTGNSTGPHLHFEVRLQGGFINPWLVLP